VELLYLKIAENQENKGFYKWAYLRVVKPNMEWC
jgi:hypothetical protein